MNFILLFLVSCTLLKLFCAQVVHLNEYLDEKLRQSKIEFIKIHIQEISPVQEKSYNVQWDISWRVPLMAKHRPSTITMSDGIFILDGNRVIAPSLKDTALNETLTLREVDQIEKYSAVKFAKSIVWKNAITYLLVCYELGLCSLHTGMQSSPLRFRHTIGHRGIPVDATFFIQDDRLHLVVANNANKFAIPSVIYRWSGTYMDVICEVMTIGAVSVTAFEHRQSTIILFAQSDDENPRIGSEVYEFKESNIVRIQFLSTNKPIAVHHYVHGDFNFVLMINELKPSSVLCWDGRELLDWFSLPEIKPHSLINVFHMDGNTFIVVAYDNVVQLYKFHSTSDWKSENIKYFKDGQEIVDMTVWMKSCTMFVMLVIMEEDAYWVEQWEAEIASLPHESVIGDTDIMRKCLSDLIETLQKRMPAIKKAEASWEFLLPSAKNLTALEAVRFDNLILQSGIVRNIDVTTEGEEILRPHQIQKTLNEFSRDVADILSDLQKIVNATVSDLLKGDITVNDVFLDELQIDKMHVDFVNDANIQSDDVIFSESEQQFANPLRAKNITVHNLKIDSLCGIPFQYWRFRNNTANTFSIANDLLEYSNQTVIVHSDLMVPKLKAKSLNGTVIDQFIDNLFIINRNQRVKGKIIYKNLLNIMNLTMQKLNGIPADKFMTTTTKQSFYNFFIKIMDIDNLSAETINGIPIDETARKSRKNIIKGEIKLASLHVTKNFTIHVNSSLVTSPNALQIYENVTILGNLHLQNLKIEKIAALFMNDIQLNITDIFDIFWTKSTNQIITRDITFENGLTIDMLNTKYLNGFVESDFLYITAHEISREFINLYFENFHVDELFFKDGHNISFFQIASESLTIREDLHVQSLRAKDIITLAFNGMTVDSIMNGSQANFSGITEFPNIRTRRVLVSNLDLYFLNNRNVYIKNGLRVDDDHQIDILMVPEFHARNLKIERLNGTEISFLSQLMNLTNSNLSSIVINGDLIIEHLKVRQIGNQPPENFLNELVKRDIHITSESKIENLIVQNITLESIHDWEFDGLITSILLKSGKQMIPGHFWAQIITSNNTEMDFINKRNTSQLMWINEPLAIIGNVTFLDLFVKGDIISSNLNGCNVQELYDNLLIIPARNIDLLRVDGSISWNKSLSSPSSISYLLKNAVTKDTCQAITGSVIFDSDVHVWIATAALYEIDEIRSIILDAIIDYGEIIEISGRKFFEDDIIVDSLIVSNDLGVLKINHVNILEFNNSIVRKNLKNTIIGPLIFLKEIKVEKLYSNSTALNISISAAVLSVDVLPHNVFFESLTVLGDVYLKNFDGIDFDGFVNDRVTLRGHHDISSDIRFNGIVTVKGNADIRKINGIHPSEFVLNGTEGVQNIFGIKTFEKDFIMEGNITAPQINNVDMLKEYADGVQNDENVDIFSDLVFKRNIRISNMNVSELVNGIDLHSAVSSSREKRNGTLQSLKEHEGVIEQNIRHSSQLSETLRNIFSYLEMEENLRLHTHNINKIDVMYIEKTTKLSMYGEQTGKFCGLPSDNCSCPYQYVVELSADGVRELRMNSSNIVRNFYNSDSVFTINLETNTVSSSKECNSTGTDQEFSTISLTRLDIRDSGEIMPLVTNVSHKVEGYLKDAEVFNYDSDMYIVLAIHYDKTRGTHRVNSLLYKVDMLTGNVILVQEIPTYGAWSIEIFKIDREVFLLIGCYGVSSQSLLYKFDSITLKFQQLRTFASSSRYVKSLSQGKDHFILLDNPHTNAVNIFQYDSRFRNFYSYQSIFHEHRVNGIECFYAGDSGNSDTFVIVTTQGGQFYIYEYMFAGKFQMKLQNAIDDLQAMVPFYHMDKHYILVGTNRDSMIFRIV